MRLSLNTFLPLALAAAPHTAALTTPHVAALSNLQSAQPQSLPVPFAKRDEDSWMITMPELPVAFEDIKSIVVSVSTNPSQVFHITDASILGTLTNGGLSCSLGRESKLSVRVGLGDYSWGASASFDLATFSFSFHTFRGVVVRVDDGSMSPYIKQEDDCTIDRQVMDIEDYPDN